MLINSVEIYETYKEQIKRRDKGLSNRVDRMAGRINSIRRIIALDVDRDIFQSLARIEKELADISKILGMEG